MKDTYFLKTKSPGNNTMCCSVVPTYTILETYAGKINTKLGVIVMGDMAREGNIMGGDRDISFT